MNKKGVVTDMLYWLIGSFLVVFLIVISYYLLDLFGDAFHDVDILDNETLQPYDDFVGRFSSVWDNTGLMIVLAGHISIMILAVLLRNHPILFIALFLFLIVLVVLGAYMANAFNDIMSTDTLSSYAEEFTILNWIMDNFLLFNMVMGILDIIVFLAAGALSGRGEI